MQSAAEITLRKKMVGVLLRYTRSSARLSVREVVDASGFSEDAISSFESGHGDITLPQLEVLADLYDVPMALFWSDEPSLPVESAHGLPVAEIIQLRQRIIGVLLRQAREETGRTQAELAELLTSDVARIGEVEAGRAAVSLTELETMAAFLNRPIEYFLDEGIRPKGDRVVGVSQMADQCRLPADIWAFMELPGSERLVRLAMRLAQLPGGTLRSLGEGFLDISGQSARVD